MCTLLKKCNQSIRKKLFIKFCSNEFTKSKIKKNHSQPKTFYDIPGPKSLPIIGTLYKYLPFIGKKIKLNLIYYLYIYNTTLCIYTILYFQYNMKYKFHNTLLPIYYVLI